MKSIAEKMELSPRPNLTRTSLLALFTFVTLFACKCDSAALSSRAQGQGNSKALAGSSSIVDLDGRPVDPFQTADVKAYVFVFVSNECPISNRYVPEIRRLVEEFGKRHAAFWLVNPNADESAEAIRKHAREYDYPCAVLRDPGHALVKRAGAKVTPEAAVFDASGKLVYHGRIDDRYVDLGDERPAASTHDLEEVLSSVVQGKPVLHAAMRAVGCYIPKE